jgi:chorismate mutase
MAVRGIRAANTVEHNDEQEILQATEDMLRKLIEANQVKPEDVGCIFITVTQDLDAAFPARAVRAIPGWERVPLMHALEIPVPGSLAKCIRMMVLVNTDKEQKDIVHIYLNGATQLRPDLLPTFG